MEKRREELKNKKKKKKKKNKKGSGEGGGGGEKGKNNEVEREGSYSVGNVPNMGKKKKRKNKKKKRSRRGPFTGSVEPNSSKSTFKNVTFSPPPRLTSEALSPVNISCCSMTNVTGKKRRRRSISTHCIPETQPSLGILSPAPVSHRFLPTSKSDPETGALMGGGAKKRDKKKKFYLNFVKEVKNNGVGGTEDEDKSVDRVDVPALN